VPVDINNSEAILQGVCAVKIDTEVLPVTQTWEVGYEICRFKGRSDYIMVFLLL
jgi:hypothetical protein